MNTLRWMCAIVALWAGIAFAADEHPAQILVSGKTAKVLEILTETASE